VICPSVWPFDHGEAIRGANCGLVIRDATREGGDETCAGALNTWHQGRYRLVRIIAWKLAMSSRASTSAGMPASTAATVTVSAFESLSLPICELHRGTPCWRFP
jgi:hypothetical protein